MLVIHAVAMSNGRNAAVVPINPAENEIRLSRATGVPSSVCNPVGFRCSAVPEENLSSLPLSLVTAVSLSLSLTLSLPFWLPPRVLPSVASACLKQGALGCVFIRAIFEVPKRLNNQQLGRWSHLCSQLRGLPRVIRAGAAEGLRSQCGLARSSRTHRVHSQVPHESLPHFPDQGGRFKGGLSFGGLWASV